MKFPIFDIPSFCKKGNNIATIKKIIIISNICLRKGHLTNHVHLYVVTCTILYIHVHVIFYIEGRTKCTYLKITFYTKE